ncbi:MAG: FAD/NAD(P)-binding oxidoreductase [Desulfomonilaceae bacterium]|nr:FAD/NAD(P)-binding oxidoreductase [Desulfomonilaceae bacterium]
MDRAHCVIIGNGPAANSAAFTLRDNDPDLRITVIGEERDHEYRPDLLPDYIAGKATEEDLFIGKSESYKGHDIKLRLGQRVVHADFQQRELLLEHNEVVRFTGLIIACGAKPRIPEPLAVFEDLMLTLKTPADARLWIERLARVDTILIVGGDLTSLSLTKALLHLGKRVVFMLDCGSFWPVPFSPELREQVARKLTEHGVEVTECTKIRRISRISDHSFEVATDRRTMVVGILGAFFGLVPNVKFLAGSGLDIERGILVDEYLKTSRENVYAAGDCAQVYHPEIRDYWVSIGYTNAVELGKAAALNLLGDMVAVNVKRESILEVDGINVNSSWWMEF